jgi:hypothetical protein
LSKQRTEAAAKILRLVAPFEEDFGNFLQEMMIAMKNDHSSSNEYPFRVPSHLQSGRENVRRS